MNKTQKVVTSLTVILIAIVLSLSLIAVNVEDGGSSFVVNSIRGQLVEIYGGTGMYHFDTVEKAIMMRSYDWYYLLVGIPILIIGLILYLRRSTIGYFILISSLFFLIYSFLISSIAISYNPFFLAYMAVYVISTYAVIYMIKDVSFEHFRQAIIPKLPINTIAIFVMFLASYFIVSWLVIDFTTLLSGGIHPDLAIYTTADMNVTDLSIYATVSISGAVLLLKRKALGAIISIGMIGMAFQTLTALSIFTFLKVDFHHESISNIDFPLVIFAVVCMIFSVIAVRRLRGIHYQFKD